MSQTKGAIAWMASNPVAANLLMALFVVGGLLFAGTVKQEVFPEVELDVISVSMAYPGASPEEVEEGIVLAIEEALRSVDGVKKVTSTSGEGIGSVAAELELSADPDRALSDIKSEVDRIRSFPANAEEPVVAVASTRTQVLSIVIHGSGLTPKDLRNLTETYRADLLDDPRVTVAEIGGLPPPEISIEVSQTNLRRYGLTLDEVARRVGAASIDLPGGAVKTPGGEVLLRTTEKRDFGNQYGDIAIVSGADGTSVTLARLATVIDGFRDTDTEAYYNGEPAARIQVYRTSEQSPLEVAEAAKEFIDIKRASLPPDVGITITDDTSQIFRDRISLLLRNGAIGVLLVLIVLGIFLAPRLAFWVTLGMPISFLGVFLFMPALDVSINMISLFAFILTLGIVVDDAVVVGEAAFTHRAMGKRPLQAAIDGAREVRLPVTFAVFTTIIAFSPLLFVPGVMGKFFTNIPLIVIPVLVISLIESLFVLPAHVGHIRLDRETEHKTRASTWFFKTQKQFSRWMEHMIADRYVPFLHRVIEVRYLTVALAVAVLIIAVGTVAGGRLVFEFFPSVEADQVDAAIQLPFGAPADETRAVMQRLIAEATAIGADVDQDSNSVLITGIYSEIGTTQGLNVPITAGGQSGGGHVALVTAYLAPAGDRQISAAEFASRWRSALGDLPGVDRLSFTYDTGPQSGAPVSIELSHRNPTTLETAAAELASDLEQYAGVTDIDDGFQLGKPQLDLQLKPAARSLGVNERELANQVRNAFYGAEAKRQQRGRDELRVYVRLPEEERQSLYFLENLVVRTPAGGEIPLRQAATIVKGNSFTSIERTDGRRVVEVTADVDSAITTGGQITRSLEADVIPALLQRNPGLTYRLSGEQEAQAESMAALGRGMLFALIAMYAIMAVAFHSYVQPFLVLMAIPFGLIGAVIGHLVMGYNLSLVSVLGLVALSGVVINDLLVLIYAIDSRRDEGIPLLEAIVSGAARRVRPVLLTSLTTFFGLSPMIFETSLQARFLIPMALSLGFGVLFVTVIALLLLPAAYMTLEDIKTWLRPDAEPLKREVSPT